MLGTLLIYAVLIAFAAWLLILRPVRRQKAQRIQVTERLKPGARVMLTSGLLGTVVEVANDEVELDVGNGRAPAVRLTRRRDDPGGRPHRGTPRPSPDVSDGGDRTPGHSSAGGSPDRSVGRVAPRVAGGATRIRDTASTVGASPADPRRTPLGNLSGERHRMARQPVATGATAPGRFLAVLAIVIVALGAWMVLTGHHKPKLGLDLQGGTSVTLIPQAASGQARSPTRSIDQAVDIIRQRVNGRGVAEAEVTRQGSGATRPSWSPSPARTSEDLLDKVGQTAKLTFRPVLADRGRSRPCPRRAPRRQLRRVARPVRRLATASVKAPAASATPTAASSASAAGRPTRAPWPLHRRRRAPSPARAVHRGLTASAAAGHLRVSVSGAAVDPAELQASTRPPCTLRHHRLHQPGQPRSGSTDDPDKTWSTCDRDGQTKYLLGAAAGQGHRHHERGRGPSSAQTNEWVVNLEFNGTGTKQFARSRLRSRKRPGPDATQFAIVLDGLVVSAPAVNDAIVDGNAQITGNFTQARPRTSPTC